MHNVTVVSPERLYRNSLINLSLITAFFSVLLVSLVLYVKYDFVFDLPQDESVNIPMTSSAKMVRSFTSGGATLVAGATRDQFDAVINADQFMLYTKTALYGGLYGVKYRWIDQYVPEGLGHRAFTLSVDDLKIVNDTNFIEWEANIDLEAGNVTYSAGYSNWWNFLYQIFWIVGPILVIIICFLLFGIRVTIENYRR